MNQLGFLWIKQIQMHHSYVWKHDKVVFSATSVALLDYIHLKYVLNIALNRIEAEIPSKILRDPV